MGAEELIRLVEQLSQYEAMKFHILYALHCLYSMVYVIIIGLLIWLYSAVQPILSKRRNKRANNDRTWKFMD